MRPTILSALRTSRGRLREPNCAAFLPTSCASASPALTTESCASSRGTAGRPRERHSSHSRIAKTTAMFIACFGILLVVGKLFGISFIGIKYILYYAIFYGFGWLVKWTEGWWKRWWIKIANVVYFICLVVFLVIIFNYDLYHTDDGLVSICIRAIAGFTGNAVILAVCRKYVEILGNAKVDVIGKYTLEIYATHMCVNNLMEMEKSFFTAAGFENFICSLILTVIFTLIIIATFKTFPLADFIFYGKTRKKA